MQTLATSLALTAPPAIADVFSCALDDGSALSFAIDDSQFSRPLDAKEPPRQQRTIVSHDARTFAATPFRLGPVRGFEAAAPDGSTTVFVVQADGSALFTNAKLGLSQTGRCEVQSDAD